MFLVMFMLLVILSPFIIILAPLLGGLLAFGIVMGWLFRLVDAVHDAVNRVLGKHVGLAK
ncbi:hypothetical protein [Ectobacillus ponti]|uniref:Uncharacterized protein n=1 Tax=Ectobacillus ponti TaxID=2961894 RepID=A0AA42BTX9_9BACI|nr:hypothetical protein [Ectobacillus ponti]MCP8969958.1 hypothetical protein [Ectobacillus ponti]